MYRFVEVLRVTVFIRRQPVIIRNNVCVSAIEVDQVKVWYQVAIAIDPIP